MDCEEVICDPNASIETSAPSSVISRIWVRASMELEWMVISGPICVALVRAAAVVNEMALWGAIRLKSAFSIEAY